MTWYRCSGGGTKTLIDGEKCKENLSLVTKKVTQAIVSVPQKSDAPDLVVLNGEVYLFPLGITINGSVRPGGTVYVWDGVSWEQKAKPPASDNGITYYGSFAVFGNEIHYVGTYNGTIRSKHCKLPVNGTSWVDVSTPPVHFTHNSSVVLNGELHVMAGSSHFKWDGVSWTSVSTLPYSFVRGSAVVLNGEIHILGSTSSTVTNKRSHYKWNGATWTSVSTLPSYVSSASVIAGEIHVFNVYQEVSTHYKWDGTTWTWEKPFPFQFRRAAMSGDEMYFVNSYISDSSYYNADMDFDQMLCVDRKYYKAEEYAPQEYQLVSFSRTMDELGAAFFVGSHKTVTREYNFGYDILDVTFTGEATFRIDRTVVMGSDIYVDVYNTSSSSQTKRLSCSGRMLVPVGETVKKIIYIHKTTADLGGAFTLASGGTVEKTFELGCEEVVEITFSDEKGTVVGISVQSITGGTVVVQFTNSGSKTKTINPSCSGRVIV